jgi:hypothetical protein
LVVLELDDAQLELGPVVEDVLDLSGVVEGGDVPVMAHIGGEWVAAILPVANDVAHAFLLIIYAPNAMAVRGRRRLYQGKRCSMLFLASFGGRGEEVKERRVRFRGVPETAFFAEGADVARGVRLMPRIGEVEVRIGRLVVVRLLTLAHSDISGRMS